MQRLKASEVLTNIDQLSPEARAQMDNYFAQFVKAKKHGHCITCDTYLLGMSGSQKEVGPLREGEFVCAVCGTRGRLRHYNLPGITFLYLTLQYAPPDVLT